jgi:hypothetical protein
MFRDLGLTYAPCLALARYLSKPKRTVANVPTGFGRQVEVPRRFLTTSGPVHPSSCSWSISFHEKTLVLLKASQGSFRPIPVDIRGDSYVVVQGINPALLFRRDTRETQGQPPMFLQVTYLQDRQDLIA